MDIRKIAEKHRILEVRVGSHLFGTDTPESDLDLFGIFMPNAPLVFGTKSVKEVDLGRVDKDDTGRNTADAVDRKLHEFRRFCALAMQNNPNILHVLWANEPNIVFADERGFGRTLLENAHLFPHKGAHHRFVKYADSQRHKMKIKPENYRQLEDGLKVLEEMGDNQVMADVIQHCLAQVHGVVVGAPFTDKGSGKHIRCGDLSIERGVFVKKARKMIRERLSKATNRFTLFTKYGYDTKFASNLIQLLMEGIELMETGRIQFPLAYASDILDIKQGKHSADHISEWADGLVEDARRAYEKSELPTSPRANEIETFVVNQVKDYLLGGAEQA